MAAFSEALVFDATCPPDLWLSGYADWMDGGFNGCALSVGGPTPAAALASVAAALKVIRSDERLTPAMSAGDVRAAQQERRLAVMLHTQSTAPFGDDVDLVEVFWRLGVRMAGLAYNQRGAVCDGCEVSDDEGVTAFGREVIAEMNRVGMLVDFAHTGWRSCANALSLSSRPCITTHSNAHAVQAHPRNLPDDLIRGIAESGGMVGMNGFPAFVADGPRPTLDQLIDHMVHIDSLVGTGHVGLGLDYCSISMADYEEMIDSGAWTTANYPPPPWNYPAGIENPRTMESLAVRMSERSYQEPEILGILGENWMRLFDRVWAE